MKLFFFSFFGALMPAGVGLAQEGFRFTMGWLPPNVNPAYGGQIDYLYSVIFIIVFIIFFLTEGALLWFLFAYRQKDGQRAHYTHGNKTVELIWSIIPAGILVWLAFYQKGTWDFIRTAVPPLEKSLVVQVFPEQFSWNFRYAGPDGRFGTQDDVMTINELHVPVGKNVVALISAKDVLHSFFIPYARVKQDAVPGMRARAWFQIDRLPVFDRRKQTTVLLTPEEYQERVVALGGFYELATPLDKTGKKKFTYEPLPGDEKILVSDHGKIRVGTREETDAIAHHFEIVCAELCGLGHYRMRAFLKVEPQAVFDRWMAEQVEEKTRAAESKWTQLWDKNHPQFNEL